MIVDAFPQFNFDQIMGGVSNIVYGAGAFPKQPPTTPAPPPQWG